MVQLINPLAAVNEGQQFVDGLFTQRANRQAGSALQQGNYNQAAGALFGNGDLRGGMGVQQYGQEQQAAQQAQTAAQKAQQLQATLQIVGTVKRARDQGQDVSQILPQYRDAFIAMGTDPQQLSQIEQQVAANPAFLDQIEQIVGQQARELTFQKAGDNLLVFEPGNPDPVRSFNAPKKPIELNGVLVDPDTYEPILDTRQPEYIQRDPTKELIEVTPGGGSQAPAEHGSGTRGQRNNNPGNIEDGAFARSLPGYAGSDGRFAIFDSPQAGTQAGAELLNRYAARGVVTPAQVINRWAPPSDNNPTQAYAAYVANRLGIGVNDPIPANRRVEAFQAINEFENGGQRPSSGPARTSGPRVVSGATASAENVVQLSPQEVQSLGLPEGTVAQRKPDGSVNVISRGGSERYTDGQRGSAAFAFRLQNAARSLETLAQNGVARPSPAILAFGNGQLQENALNSTDRRWLQAAREWLAPVLRKDTGAAVGPGELVTYMGIYLPSPTDDQATLQQKAQARRVAEQALRAQAGGAYNEMFPQNAAATSTRPRTNAPGLRFNVTEAQLQTRQRIVGQGGRSSQPLGSTQNPRYLNPSDPRSSYNNVRRGEYYVSPDGQMRQKR